MRVQRFDLQSWLHGIAEISSAVNSSVSLSSLLDLVAETACNLMDVAFCGVLLPDNSQSTLLIEGSHGLSREYITEVNARHPITLQYGETRAPSSRAFLTRKPVQTQDVESDPGFRTWGPGAKAQGFSSMISVPLLVFDKALGTLNCYTTRTHQFGPEEVELLTTLANQAAVAIDTARLRETEARTISDLRELNSSLSQQRDLLHQGDDIHERLTNVVLHEGGVAGVATALAELLDSPVTVDDPSGRQLAAITRTDASPPTSEEISAIDEQTAVFDTAGSRIVAITDADKSVPLMTAPVYLHSEIVARIWFPGQLADLSPLDHRAVEHATTVLALELLRHRAAMDAEWRMAGEIVSDVVVGTPVTQQGLLSRAQRLGHDLSQPHSVLVSRIDGDHPDELPRLLNAARVVAAPFQSRLLVATVGIHIVVLWPRQDSGMQADEAADKIRAAFSRSGSRQSVSIAVSAEYSTVQEYARAFRLSRGAVDLANLRGTTDATLLPRDLGPMGLLLQLEHISELEAFAAHVLQPLRDYDERRGASLTETVAAYVRNDLNTARTARDLYVHPNTIGLRVRRAEELLDRSLNATDSIIHIGLALMADEVTRVTTTG